MTGGEPFALSTSCRLVVRDVAAGVELWLRHQGERGAVLAPESLAVLRAAREWLADTPLAPSLAGPVEAQPFAREYDTARVAEVLGVTGAGARWLAGEGRLPARKVDSGAWRFDADAVDARARVGGPAGVVPEAGRLTSGSAS